MSALIHQQQNGTCQPMENSDLDAVYFKIILEK